LADRGETPERFISSALRVRQGLILLVGGVAVALIIGASAAHFYWTPLALGLVYLATALAGGARGSYWATAVVLLGWGSGVVIVGAAKPDLDVSGVYLAGAGLGASVGVLLGRFGVAVETLGLTATVALGGVVLAVEPHWPSALGDARTYALLLGLIGVFNVAVGTLRRGARGV